MASPMDMRSIDNTSHWIDILAGSGSAMDFEPKQYTAGVFTACNTAECSPFMESIASSPECAAHMYDAYSIEGAWQQGDYGYAGSTFPRDELDELLEELARDTSCPYLQQLTVPNLMAASLPQPTASYTPDGAYAGTCGSVACQQLPPPPPPLQSLRLAGGQPISVQSLLGCPHPAAAAAATAEPDAAAAGANFTGMLRGVDISIVPEPGTAAAPAPEGQGAAVTAARACPQLVAVLAVRGGSGSAGEWGEGGNSQVCLQTTSLLQDVTCRTSSGLVQTAATDAVWCAGGAAAGAAAGSVDGGGCLPAWALNCGGVHPYTEDGMQALVAPPGPSIDTAGLADQPPSKGNTRELWLSKGLRRLRSIVRVRSTGSSSSRVKPVTEVAEGAAAPARRAASGRALLGGGEASVSDPDDAGGDSDQRCWSKGGGAAGAAGLVATEGRTSRVRLLAKRLRAISHNGRPQ